MPSVEYCPCPSVFPRYARKERDDYPTPSWVTETVIPHLKAHGATSIWDPGDGQIVAALRQRGLDAVGTDIIVAIF